MGSVLMGGFSFGDCCVHGKTWAICGRVGDQTVLSGTLDAYIRCISIDH